MPNQTDDIQAVEKLGQARDAIVTELRKTIVGMDDVIDEMMIAIFTRGHCLLVGVPVLAKTLLHRPKVMLLDESLDFMANTTLLTKLSSSSPTLR